MTTDPNDPVVTVDAAQIAVDPGSEARVSITLRNPTTIVEEYAIEVLGPASPWATVEPPRVNVMPGTNATASIVLRPARVPPPPAGPTPFAIHCISQLDHTHATVVEADLEVGGFKELFVKVAPTTSKGVRRGKHRVVITNRGNLEDRVRLNATDANDELRFKFSPETVDVPGPGQVETKLTAKAHTTFLKGPPKQHRFELSYGPLLPAPGDQPEAPKTPVAFTQRPWLSGPVVALLALLVVLGVLAGVLINMREGPASQAEERELVVPEFRAVDAAGIDSLRLAWEAVPDTTQYRIQRFSASTTGAQPTMEEERTAAGTLDTFVWTGLQPGTEYCFQIIAATTIGQTPPSESTCTSTAPLAPFATPTDFQALPVEGTNNVQLSWTPSSPDARHVVFVDDVPLAERQASSVQLAVAPGSHCFAVAGEDAGGAQTPQTGKLCFPVGPPPADTTAPTTPTVPATEGPGGDTTATSTAPTDPRSTESPGTDGTGTGTTPATPPGTATQPTGSTPGTATTVSGTTAPPTTVLVTLDWVVLEAIPTGDFSASEPLQRAQEARNRFAAGGFDASLAPSEDLGLEGTSSWIVYIDDLDGRQAADDLCRSIFAAGLMKPGQNCVFQERNTG